MDEKQGKSRLAYLKNYQKEWVADRQRIYKELMGGCLFCGSLEKIEIHHIDPDKKDEHRIWSWREDRLLAELRQCVAMCHGCHKKFHGLLKRKPLEHGTLHGYQVYGCRCLECKAARTENYFKKEKGLSLFFNFFNGRILVKVTLPSLRH